MAALLLQMNCRYYFYYYYYHDTPRASSLHLWVISIQTVLNIQTGEQFFIRSAQIDSPHRKQAHQKIQNFVKKLKVCVFNLNHLNDEVLVVSAEHSVQTSWKKAQKSWRKCRDRFRQRVLRVLL